MEVSKQITLFLNHVELLKEDDVEGVDELIGNINEVIADIMTAARKRQTQEESIS